MKRLIESLRDFTAKRCSPVHEFSRLHLKNLIFIRRNKVRNEKGEKRGKKGRGKKERGGGKAARAGSKARLSELKIGTRHRYDSREN